MRTIITQMLKDIQYLNTHKLMDYSLLLITEENPFYQDRRKLTLQSKQNAVSKSSEPRGTHFISNQKHGHLPEVPELLETENAETGFTIPEKRPERTEFSSVQNVMVNDSKFD